MVQIWCLPRWIHRLDANMSGFRPLSRICTFPCWSFYRSLYEESCNSKLGRRELLLETVRSWSWGGFCITLEGLSWAKGCKGDIILYMNVIWMYTLNSFAICRQFVCLYIFHDLHWDFDSWQNREVTAFQSCVMVFLQWVSRMRQCMERGKSWCRRTCGQR